MPPQEPDRTLNTEHMETGHEKISFTALNVAYYRTFSDIPYSQEIYEAMVATCDPGEFTKFDSHKSKEIAPLAEARYKLINKLLAESKTDQVLELAAGFSPRGLQFTSINPGITYVEIDLPQKIQEKEQILKNLRAGNPTKPPEGLHLQAGNVLDENTFKKAAAMFKQQPMTIINEGLLRYLNFEERTAVAKSIRALLQKFGGAWITPDISVENKSQTHNSAIRAKLDAQRQKIAQESSTDINQNRFKNVAEAKEFFENLDFNIHIRSFNEILGELASPARLGLTQKQVEELIGDGVVFVMEPSID